MCRCTRTTRRRWACAEPGRIASIGHAECDPPMSFGMRSPAVGGKEQAPQGLDMGMGLATEVAVPSAPASVKALRFAPPATRRAGEARP